MFLVRNSVKSNLITRTEASNPLQFRVVFAREFSQDFIVQVVQSIQNHDFDFEVRCVKFFWFVHNAVHALSSAVSVAVLKLSYSLETYSAKAIKPRKRKLEQQIAT